MGNGEIIQIAAPKLNRGDILHALTIICVLGGGFAGWQALKDTGTDHGRRILLMEEQKASKEYVDAGSKLLLSAIAEQTKQIGELKSIVATDHDSIVRLGERRQP